jgi:hypothetical protein
MINRIAPYNLHLGKKASVGVTPSLIRHKVAQRVIDDMCGVGLIWLYNMWVTANDYVDTFAAKHIGQGPLLSVCLALILYAPVHAGYDAVGAITWYRAQVALDYSGVYKVYNTPFGNRHAISAICVV